MQLQLNDDKEAWEFLNDVVYNNNQGEFRIHTNKKGFKLYIRFTDRAYTGFYNDYISRFKGRVRYMHRSDYNEKTSTYAASLVAPTLVEVLNKHLDEMPGDQYSKCGWEFDEYMAWGTTKEWSGSVDDFRKLKVC